MIILPEWTIPFQKKIDDLIRDLCNKENINYGLVRDSISIEQSKQDITMSLFNIQEKAEGNVPDEAHEDFKKIATERDFRIFVEGKKRK